MDSKLPDKITYDVSAMAVGMSISFLSMLLNSHYNFHINVDSKSHSLILLKKIYRIPDNKISVSVTNTLTNNIFWELSDVGKITSPYISPNTVFINNREIDVAVKDTKPCIALACYQDKEHLKNFDETDHNWPNNRYWSLQHYSKIFNLIKDSGYEVITLDNNLINLDDKVYWLNEYCDAVIGYEGGLCHLAHTLRIPTIILPWRPYESFLNLDSLHLDKRTYFVRTIEEINSWKTSNLLDVIDMCKNEITNNVFYTGKVTFASNFSEYNIKTEYKEYSMMAGIRKFEIDFFLNKIKENTLFGKPITFITGGDQNG